MDLHLPARRVFAFALFLFLAMAQSLALAQAKASLKVTGNLVRESAYTLEQLAKLPQTEITSTRETNRSDGKDVRRISYRGVLLKDVLDAAGFAEQKRHDFRRTVLVVRATDGYAAVFSWGELFNSDAGKNVLVITSEDGTALTSAEGPFALRSFGDHRPGPRHVRWLNEIRVQALEP